MKVILQQDVKGQGKKGQMIEAAEGYARNSLLPRKRAIPATADAINTMKLQEKAKKAQEAKLKAEAEAVAETLKNIQVKIPARSGANGKLFGAVTSKEVSDALLAQHGIELGKQKIVMDEPIKARLLPAQSQAGLRGLRDHLCSGDRGEVIFSRAEHSAGRDLRGLRPRAPTYFSLVGKVGKSTHRGQACPLWTPLC